MESSILSSSREAVLKSNKRSSKICCMPSCSNTEASPAITMHKVPNGKTNQRYGKYVNMEKWSNDFFQIILKYRAPNDNNLRKRLKEGKVFICSKHFEDGAIIHSTHISWLKFGALPVYFLPKKSHENESPKKRRKLMSIGNLVIPEQHSKKSSARPTLEVIARKFNSNTTTNWSMFVHNISTENESFLHFTYWTLENAKLGIPSYNVVVNENLSFTVTIFGIPVPSNNKIYEQNLIDKSIQEILKEISALKICSGFTNVGGKPPNQWLPVTCYSSENGSLGTSGVRLVYEATVECKGLDKKTYYGLIEGAFKTRYRNHIKSFNHVKYKNETELSKLVWAIKEAGKDYHINWRVVARAPAYHCRSRHCDLCLTEKVMIALANSRECINKGNEIMSKC